MASSSACTAACGGLNVHSFFLGSGGGPLWLSTVAQVVSFSSIVVGIPLAGKVVYSGVAFNVSGVGAFLHDDRGAVQVHAVVHHEQRVAVVDHVVVH